MEFNFHQKIYRKVQNDNADICLVSFERMGVVEMTPKKICGFGSMLRSSRIFSEKNWCWKPTRSVNLQKKFRSGNYSLIKRCCASNSGQSMRLSRHKLWLFGPSWAAAQEVLHRRVCGHRQSSREHCPRASGYAAHAVA
jgi:hypothetical protein